MNKKIIATLIVLLFCAGCLGIASAENSTNETMKNNESADMSSYIRPVSITDNRIEFSDGFIGFCLNLTKDPITTDDGFTSQQTGNDEIQNYIKLAIIEAYKQGCEDKLGKIIASFTDGTYKNSDDKVIAAVLKSTEVIGDNASVELEDSMEGNFEFELLKDVKGEKSDCLAYKVSLKEMPDDAKRAAASDDNTTNDTNNNTSDNRTDNATDNKTDNSTDQKTVVNESNETNTVIINENNTTIINQNNTKIINKANDSSQNATLPEKIMRTVGNPIFLLIVVIVIAAVAAVVIRRKGQ